MTLIRRSMPLLFALSASLALPAGANECRPVVTSGWVRLPPVAMPMLAGFGRIENPCKVAIVVTGASSPEFDDVSLHQTSTVDGISRMRAVPALTIAPGKAATLAPGGLHLMLMRPVKPLREGDEVTVELALGNGGSVRADLEVRAP